MCSSESRYFLECVVASQFISALSQTFFKFISFCLKYIFQKLLNMYFLSMFLKLWLYFATGNRTIFVVYWSFFSLPFQKVVSCKELVSLHLAPKWKWFNSRWIPALVPLESPKLPHVCSQAKLSAFLGFPSCLNVFVFSMSPFQSHQSPLSSVSASFLA